MISKLILVVLALVSLLFAGWAGFSVLGSREWAYRTTRSYRFLDPRRFHRPGAVAWYLAKEDQSTVSTGRVASAVPGD